ncbi:MAG TPA: 50S ribosomal protein L3 [bacterium]
MSGLIGRKLGMARVFDAQGKNRAVTLIEAGPCVVTQIKNADKDGYDAIQLGFEDKKDKHTNKPEAGHFAKAGSKPKRFVREFNDFDNQDTMKLGDALTVDLFKEGETVEVVGWSKGKGFQGVVKRHHFSGGPKSHGQSDRTRAPGSLGQSSYPSRVYKGLRMAGRMGNRQVTTKNSTIVKVLPDKNIIMIEGSVPGPKSGLVLIKK